MGAQLKTRSTPIAGLMLASSVPSTDHRGSFARLFCIESLREVLGQRHIVQVNQSVTRLEGAVRGLHYQRAPHAEMKLVRCLRGRVWDVAVDLRAGSATFLQWHAEELTPENAHMMIIPEGCAHGFQVLSHDSELLYLHTALYEPGAEGGIRPTDPELGIAWPLPVSDLSARDAALPLIDSAFAGLPA
jgi:dTDP-4-dehydrorhamnose 3,5-epimerase